MQHLDNPFFDDFNRQLSHFVTVGKSTTAQRIEKLNRLYSAISGNYRIKLQDALRQDLGKHETETDLTEIYPVLAEIRHTRKHLKEWMRPKFVGTPLVLTGSRSKIRLESKGVCLIISPWNYPVNLTLVPLISAIAAGNCCIIKPSELSPATSAVLGELISELFEPEELHLIKGPVETATKLLALPFHHIFFTGSPRVGKIVMQAAAVNLASCTLELGGKSPAYVGSSAAVKTTALRLAWGKSTNAGQTCIAPDYILVEESVKEALIQEISTQWELFFPKTDEKTTELTRIINEAHFNRLTHALQEAIQGGATIRYGGNYRQEDRFISPTLIENLPENSTLLNEEIFGPILPIIGVKGPEQALDIINKKERPLACYIFSNDNREIRMFGENTRAGGTCVNHNLIHYANLNLPFGGVNNSGSGKSHGYAGFLEFSHERPELRQYLPSAAELVRPPYNKLKMRIAQWTMRWF
ncbi:MAG: hypothetical protein RLZZ241_952 [Bacteroidota bacterium]|jgi:aldehyde dehydrogenase (NAD+)